MHGVLHDLHDSLEGVEAFICFYGVYILHDIFSYATKEVSHDQFHSCLKSPTKGKTSRMVPPNGQCKFLQLTILNYMNYMITKWPYENGVSL